MGTRGMQHQNIYHAQSTIQYKADLSSILQHAQQHKFKFPIFKGQRNPSK